MTTTLIDQSEANTGTIWVASHRGDDSNPGTRSAPYETIQQAVDDLIASGEQEMKIMLEGDPDAPGFFARHTESVIVPYYDHYTRKLSIEGVYDHGDELPVWEPESISEGPPIIVSTMTKEDAKSWWDNGGPSYNVTSTSVDYNGEPLVDRDGDDLTGYFEMEDIHFDTGSSEWCFITAIASHSDDSNNESRMNNCVLRNVAFDGKVMFKNLLGLVLDGCSFSGDDVYFDGVGDLYDIDQHKENNFTGSIYFRMIDTATSIDPSTASGVAYGFQKGTNMAFYNAGNVVFYGEQSDDWGRWNINQFTLHTNTGKNVSIIGSSGFGHLGQGSRVNTGIDGELEINNDRKFIGGRVRTNSLIKRSDCNLDIEELVTSGNVTIATGGGTNNVVHGGVIQGDLQVDSPATFELNDVVVEGNLEGDGDITMNGGGYLGSNNNTGSFTYNALQTT